MTCKFEGCEREESWRVWFKGCDGVYTSYCTEHMALAVVRGVDGYSVTQVNHIIAGVYIAVQRGRFWPDESAEPMEEKRIFVRDSSGGTQSYMAVGWAPVFPGGDDGLDILGADGEVVAHYGPEEWLSVSAETPFNRRERAESVAKEKDANKLQRVSVLDSSGSIQAYKATGWSPRYHNMYEHLDILGADGEVIAHYSPGGWVLVRFDR